VLFIRFALRNMKQTEKLHLYTYYICIKTGQYWPFQIMINVTVLTAATLPHGLSNEHLASPEQTHSSACHLDAVDCATWTHNLHSTRQSQFHHMFRSLTHHHQVEILHKSNSPSHEQMCITNLYFWYSGSDNILFQ
jgi:hypothetical protein